jgi:ADP-ribose pyrophosphatase
MEQILGSQTIWHGRVFDFVEKEIVLPNGRKTMMGMVQHPGSSAIVPVLEDGSVILIHQYRPAIQDFIWEVPAGTMDAGEDPLDCAKRELQEECGYAANHFEKVGEIWVTPGYSSECIHLFLATEMILKEPHLDEDECLSVHLFPYREVLSMVERNEIREAMTIVALQKAYPVWTERNRHSAAG